MRVPSIALVLLFFLAGCASEKVWVHSYKTTTQFYQDRAECQAMACSASPSPAYNPPAPSPYGRRSISDGFMQGYSNAQIMGATAARERIFCDCMMGRGWTLVEKQK